MNFVSVSKESIVDVCGKVVIAAKSVESCSKCDIELVIEQFLVISQAAVPLPLQIEDASRPENVSTVR